MVNANVGSPSSSKRDPGDSTAQTAVDPWLLRCGFYHGYLPREDVGTLLRKQGDFLVRLSEIKNIVVYHRKGKWYLDESLKFNSAALLFAHYMNQPLILNKVPILLQRGVGLCRWEYFHRNVKIVKTVGRGAYGEVKMAELLKRNGRTDTVAVKTVRMLLVYTSELIFVNLRCEPLGHGPALNT
ncbi:hypothetical protein RB195_014104 [Necator americanus]|uniref:SH2 domain-containing protein n=1 Tax=Necator americanus TaxID=51031 RepID=A0ABR1DYL2_NECAM